MSEYVETGDLRIEKRLHELVRDEIAPGTGVDAAAFWQSLGRIVADLGPDNTALLQRRDTLQKQLDDWHRERDDAARRPGCLPAHGHSRQSLRRRYGGGKNREIPCGPSFQPITGIASAPPSRIVLFTGLLWLTTPLRLEINDE